MDVTEEMRQAVYAADCAHWGHLPDFGNVVSGTEAPNPNDPRGFPMMVLRARDPERLPHITCTRCGRVWLVCDVSGVDYDEAVANAAVRLAPAATEPLTPKPIPGVADRPIPLAPGVIWSRLREDHPAKLLVRQRQQEREHREAVAAVIQRHPAKEK